MPKFVVRKSHDALVQYETVIDAQTPAKARSLARSFLYEGEWFATGEMSEYDDYEIGEDQGVRPLEDGETIEAFLTVVVTAQERDAVLTGLRLLQIAFETGHIAPMLRDIFTDGDAHTSLDLREIGGLCECINV
ncbi:hypothetical protein ACUSIJ_28405 [Pseudochelatococcus sp. B33]